MRSFPLMLATAVLAAAAVQAASASGSQTYSDPIGDSGAAPDISAIAVSNDNSGTLTFQISVANRTSLGEDDLLSIDIDSEQNHSTGILGTDYSVVIGDHGPLVLHWENTPGTFSISTVSLPSLTGGTFANGTVTFSLNRSDIGATGAIGFSASSSAGLLVDDADNAPDDSFQFFSYEINTAPPPPPPAPPPPPPPSPSHLTAGPIHLAKATAGKTFTASMGVSRSDGSAVQGTVACSATLVGHALAVRSKSLKHGLASCGWQLPATARGKVARGTMTVTSGGESVKRSFSTRVS